MRLIGFNFSKMSIERLSEEVVDVKINTNINIQEIKEVKSDMFQMKEMLIGVNFTYKIDYDPGVAKVEFAGNLLLGVESKVAKDVLKQWKNKKISGDFRMVLFNIILRKSNLKALQLEDEINLPSHIPMPGLRGEEDKEK